MNRRIDELESLVSGQVDEIDRMRSRIKDLEALLFSIGRLAFGLANPHEPPIPVEKTPIQ